MRAGTRLAAGGGKILGQYVAGETVVSVCDGAPQAVKFQQALIAAWVIWAGHQWIRALVKVALSRAGVGLGPLLGPAAVRRLRFPGSSGLQLG